MFTNFKYIMISISDYSWFLFDICYKARMSVKCTYLYTYNIYACILYKSTIRYTYYNMMQGYLYFNI